MSARTPRDEQALTLRGRDQEGRVVLARRSAGPAGAVGLDLGPVHVWFDVAEPPMVLGIALPAPGGSAPPDAAAREALALVVGTAASDRLVAGLREQPTATGASGGPDLPGVPTALASVALARAELQRPGRTLAQRLAAHLDAALHAAQVPCTEPAWVERRSEDAVLAAELTFAVTFDEAEALQVLTAGRLAGALRALADLGAVDLPKAQEIRRLASRLRRTHPGDEGNAAPELREAPGEPPPPPPSRPPLAAVPDTTLPDPRPEVAPESLPGALAGGPLPVAHRRGRDEVVVRVPGWGDRAAGWWARAFRAGSAVPIAAGPLHAVAGGAEALLLVPGVDGPAEIDVVERVASPRPPRRLAAAWVAQSWGAAAARAERLGHAWDAGSRWSACADWHDRAGDAGRAAAARALAPHDPTHRTSLVLLGDVLEH